MYAIPQMYGILECMFPVDEYSYGLEEMMWDVEWMKRKIYWENLKNNVIWGENGWEKVEERVESQNVFPTFDPSFIMHLTEECAQNKTKF